MDDTMGKNSVCITQTFKFSDDYSKTLYNLRGGMISCSDALLKVSLVSGGYFIILFPPIIYLRLNSLSARRKLDDCSV